MQLKPYFYDGKRRFLFEDQQGIKVGAEYTWGNVTVSLEGIRDTRKYIYDGKETEHYISAGIRYNFGKKYKEGTPLDVQTAVSVNQYKLNFRSRIRRWTKLN